jgi:hypothetical protein
MAGTSAPCAGISNTGWLMACPSQASAPKGNVCQRKLLRQQLKAEEFYIGDRCYGQEYGFFGGS